jgi:hypothetical protein
MVEQTTTYGGPNRAPLADPASVTGYAVVFGVGQGPLTAGALVIGAEGLRFEGGATAACVELSIGYAELTDVRVGRNPQERLNGHPTLLLGREGKPTIQIDALGAGFLGEIADLLGTLWARPPDRSERVAVIVPLKHGRLTRAEELVAQGPPFDPAALGLIQHEVFLSAREATFIFVGPHAQPALERATRDPSLWRVGLAWRGCITGPPRLSSTPATQLGHDARLVYSWPPPDEQGTKTVIREA